MRARSFVVPVPTKRAKKDIVDSTTFNYEGGAIMVEKKNGAKEERARWICVDVSFE